MRTVDIHPAVAGVLGAEQVTRLRSQTWDERLQCWECDRWLDAIEPAAVLVLDVVDVGQRFAVFTHPGCAASQVRASSTAEIRARRTDRVDTDGQGPDEGTDVDVVTTVWPAAAGPWPVLMISLHQDVPLDQGGPDRVDALVAALTGIGWHPVITLDAPPAQGPTGYRVRFVEPAGLVEVVDPTGQVETSGHVDAPQQWRTAVIHAGGRTGVLMGSRFLTHWDQHGPAGVESAVRAGLLVGGVVPVDLVDSEAHR